MAESEFLLRSRIIVSPDVQPRTRLSAPLVLEYRRKMKAGARFPPLLVGRMRTGRREVFYLLDGFHRLEAKRGTEEKWSYEAGALHLNEPVEEVRIVGVRDLNHAKWLALSANLNHGLRLRPAEKRAAFKAYVKAGEHRDNKRLKSAREMASEIGISHTQVLKKMREHYPSIYRGMRRAAASVKAGAPVAPEYLRQARLTEDARAALERASALAEGLEDMELRHQLGMEARTLADTLRRPFRPDEP